MREKKNYTCNGHSSICDAVVCCVSAPRMSIECVCAVCSELNMLSPLVYFLHSHKFLNVNTTFPLHSCDLRHSNQFAKEKQIFCSRHRCHWSYSTSPPHPLWPAPSVCFARMQHNWHIRVVIYINVREGEREKKVSEIASVDFGVWFDRRPTISHSYSMAVMVYTLCAAEFDRIPKLSRISDTHSHTHTPADAMWLKFYVFAARIALPSRVHASHVARCIDIGEDAALAIFQETEFCYFSGIIHFAIYFFTRPGYSIISTKTAQKNNNVNDSGGGDKERRVCWCCWSSTRKRLEEREYATAAVESSKQWLSTTR